MDLGHTVDSYAGCHELEIYPDDKLTCASVNATMCVDMSGAFHQGRVGNTPPPFDATQDVEISHAAG